MICSGSEVHRSDGKLGASRDGVKLWVLYVIPNLSDRAELTQQPLGQVRLGRTVKESDEC